MFLTGQKVVCIDDVFPDIALLLYEQLPVKDKVYVVRGMSAGVGLDCKTDELAVYLIGLVNPKSNTPPHREFGFKCERFRPLEELTEEEIRALTQDQPQEAELEMVVVR